jgi:hypothetical protein
VPKIGSRMSRRIESYVRVLSLCNLKAAGGDLALGLPTPPPLVFAARKLQSGYQGCAFFPNGFHRSIPPRTAFVRYCN